MVTANQSELTLVASTNHSWYRAEQEQGQVGAGAGHEQEQGQGKGQE